MTADRQSENRLINRLAIMMCQLELIWQKAEESEWDESFEEKYRKHQEEIHKFLEENFKICVIDTILFGYMDGEDAESKLKVIGQDIETKFPDRVKWNLEEESEIVIKFNEIDTDKIVSYVEEHHSLDLTFDVESMHADIANTYFENYIEARKYAEEHQLAIEDPTAPKKIEEITDVNDIDAQIALLLKQKEALLKKQKPTE